MLIPNLSTTLCSVFEFAQDGTEKTKGESLDLRLDIERRKKYLAREGDFNQDGARDIRETPDSSRERPLEKSSKHHKKSKYVHLFNIFSNHPQTL